MRAVGWHEVQQALTVEAAAAVRQGMGLARQHGHAKVTPLHVASAMLSAGPDLLHAACIQSRSHPLQCEALKLFFDVALDHLPAAGVSRGGTVNEPAVSNALAAAVRRAKRRSSMGQVDVKVGLEQLVVAILDDPGVCRPMHEAGFSSCQVKSDVEKGASLDHPHPSTIVGSKNFGHMVKLKVSTAATAADDDDDMRVLDWKASGTKRCMVNDGESAEGAVRAVKNNNKVRRTELHMPDNGVASSRFRYDSEGQASHARPRTGFPFGSSVTAVDMKAFTATASLLPWQRRIQDSVPAPWQHDSCPPSASFLSRLTHCAYSALSSKTRQSRLNDERHGHQMDKAYYGQLSHANPNHPESNIVMGTSSSNAENAAPRQLPKFTELTAENLKILCNGLEKGAPRHKDIAPDMAITVLQCRSGMARRAGKTSLASTSLLFHGRDSGSKKAVARQLAELVFRPFNQVNSPSSFIVEVTLERQRPPYKELGFAERLYQVIRENPHRVIMIHNIEYLDYYSEIIMKRSIATGRMKVGSGAEVSLEDAIIALSCDSNPWAWVNHGLSNHGSRISNERDGIEGQSKLPCFSLDLNACPEDTGMEGASSTNDAGMLNMVDGVFFFPLM